VYHFKDEKMKKAKSFISEHTVEFFVVINICRLLHKHFNYVVPVFPWISREGSNISKEIHISDTFKVLGVYPRRPKLKTPNADIDVKISTIFHGAEFGNGKGIPIIAACPITTNLWDLDSSSESVFFKFDKNAINKFDGGLGEFDTGTFAISD